MIELAAAVTLATLAAGSAIVLALRALPTVRLQLAGLAFLAVVLTLLNPSYMHPLFATTAGQVLVALATVMVVAGSLLIKRIVTIKV